MSIRSLLFFLFLAMNVSAQPKPVKPIMQSDPMAEKYLSALKKKFNTLRSYRLAYDMTSTNADNKSTKQSGTYIGSVEKYIIESKNLTIINDGKTQWSIDHIDQEIRVNKIAVNKSKIESPMSIIQNYASLFKYRVKETIANGILILEMIPLNKNSNFFKVDLAIQVAKNQIVYVKLYDRGGNRIFYDILSTEENIKIQESDFALNKNKYKGYEELDLRQ